MGDGNIEIDRRFICYILLGEKMKHCNLQALKGELSFGLAGKWEKRERNNQKRKRKKVGSSGRKEGFLTFSFHEVSERQKVDYLMKERKSNTLHVFNVYWTKRSCIKTPYTHI